MGTITTRELADIRAHLEASLPDTCTIQQRTWASDGMGGGTYAWSNRATAVPCRMTWGHLRGRAIVTAETIKEGLLWTLYIAQSQTIDEQDRVVHDSATYQVLQVSDAESEIGLTRVYLTRME